MTALRFYGRLVDTKCCSKELRENCIGYYRQMMNETGYRMNANKVRIEISTKCDARCITCPHGMRKLKRSGELMALGAFKEIVDIAVGEGIRNLGFGGMGEHIIHPHFAEMSNYVRKKGLHWLSLATNGYGLTEAITRTILDTGIASVIFSMNSFNRETYNRIHLGCDFDKVVANIRKFIEIAGDRVDISFSMIIPHGWRPNLSGEKSALMQTFGDYKLEIAFAHNWGDLELFVPSTTSLGVPCGRLITGEVQIKADSSVALCCQDYDNLYPFGNVLSSKSIDRVFNGEKAREIRKMHYDMRFSELEICEYCTTRFIGVDDADSTRDVI